MGNKIKQLEKGQVKWWLFEVIGLQIDDQVNWRKFVFEDSTIVNGKQLYKYLNEIDFPDYSIMTNYDPLYMKNKTFIIVQTTGVINKDNEENFKMNATNRAYEIIGLVYFVFLYLSNYRDSICFSSQIYSSSGMNITALRANKTSVSYNDFTSGEYRITTIDSPLNYSIDELLNILNSPYFRNICSAIIMKDEYICAFIRNLYITTNSPSPILQQIGSVTSIELLLKDSFKYEEISKRIEVLIEEKDFNSFVNNEKTGVINKRHLIIHKGDIPNSNDAFRAIKLASLVLINYSYLLTKYKSKENICKYLDMLNYLKHDKHIQNIDFNQSKHFEEIKNLLPYTDWIIQLLIRYYGICNSITSTNLTLEISKAIACYARIRGYELEEAYNLLTQDIYYNRQYIPDYNDFLDLYHSNIQEINESIDTHLWFHNYKL